VKKPREISHAAFLLRIIAPKGRSYNGDATGHDLPARQIDIPAAAYMRSIWRMRFSRLESLRRSALQWRRRRSR
jgi:hypothetical protein